MIKVSQLNIYPLKSAQGLSLKTAIIDQWGLQGDRTFMLVTPDGNFLSQRQLPKIATIAIEKGFNKNKVIFHIPKIDPLLIEPLFVTGTKKIQIWNDTFETNSYPKEINQWFSNYLGINCCLVSMKKEVSRQVDLGFAKKGNKTAFSDGFPILLTSEASLEDLNQKLKQPIGMDRFRPNIVVSGCDAFAEDSWEKIKINDVVFDIVKPCSRCIIPNTNQKTGVRHSEPIKVLASYRLKKGKVYFGQNLIHQSNGEISINNQVEILK